MPAKKLANPFTPGGGHIPPKLTGRGEETRLLERMLSRLKREGDEGKEPQESPYDPIKIIGPRGVGKTALLKSIQLRAESRGIRVVVCERLKREDPDGNTIEELISDIAGGKDRLLRLIEGLNLNLGQVVDIGVRLREASRKYKDIVRAVVKDTPLLLLLDEVHHYDLGPLATLLQKNQQLIAEGCRLGVVIAGTPGLDSHLNKAESTFISRARHVYIHTLSDEDAREALFGPFDDKHIKIAPDAREAMAVQTDNYPYFIQQVGDLAWEAMNEAGRREIDLALVRGIEKTARIGRGDLYGQAWLRMYAAKLVPHAHRVIELIDRNGGRVPESAVLDLLSKMSGDEVMPVYEALREDGLIWTEHGETKPCIPSFFSYCKGREQTKSPSAGSWPRSWLPDFLPGFSLPKKRG